jgi:Fe2+ or Zn2+ uptake regulation protein
MRTIIIISLNMRKQVTRELIGKKSQQRNIIIDVLSKTKSHPTAKEIYKKVQKKFHEVGLATIYRNLDFLEKNNKIIKLKTKDKEARYDGITKKHCHLICRECGQIFDLMDVGKIIIRSKQLTKLKFKIDSSYAEMFGVCSNCYK